MGYFFVMGLLITIGIGAYFLARTAVIREPDTRVLNAAQNGYEIVRGASRPAIPGWAVPTATVVAVLLVTVLSSVNTIATGHVGIVYQFGAIIGETSDGLVMLPPWQSVIEANVQEQKAFFKNPNNDEEKKSFLGRIDAASIETQNVYMDVTLNWRPDRGHVRDLYANVGPNFFPVLVTSRVQELFKNEVVKFTAIDVTRKRAEIGDNVVKALNGELNKYGITVTSIQLDNLWYSGEFDQAIEKKQVATQEALREQELVSAREAQARQAEAVAKGEALANAARAEGESKAAISRATGEAESIRLRAIAQAEANLKVSQSLTPDLVRTQSIAKWDGKFPPVIPSGSVPFIDPMSLFGR